MPSPGGYNSAREIFIAAWGVQLKQPRVVFPLPREHHTMEAAGQRLRKIRESLGLKYRQVEEASQRIAELHQNAEFAIFISRLSEIENKGLVPGIFRIYSLCVIYRIDYQEVLRWYNVDVSGLAADVTRIDLEGTHLFRFGPDGHGLVQVPLALDPGLDLRQTIYLSRMIQRWGVLPLALLNAMDLKNHRYGFIGTEDWFMFPLVPPGALVLIDETRRKVIHGGWNSEFERPIYFLETRQGYACGWCTQTASQMVLQPHPASDCTPLVFASTEIEVIGQVVGVAKRLDLRRRRTPL